MARMTKAQFRLKQVNDAHDKSHKVINVDFHKAYVETLRAHGLATPKDFSEHLALPVEFHADLADAKKACVAQLMLAQEARQVSARTVEKPRYRR